MTLRGQKAGLKFEIFMQLLNSVLLRTHLLSAVDVNIVSPLANYKEVVFMSGNHVPEGWVLLGNLYGVLVPVGWRKGSRLVE